tara:strand:- start:324 stop:512 length:189 start_codon:yes stop_codon:yes gene_type:complete
MRSAITAKALSFFSVKALAILFYLFGSGSGFVYFHDLHALLSQNLSIARLAKVGARLGGVPA